MSQLQCADCGSALTPEDIFCGTCGTAVSAANRGGAPRAEPVQVSTMAPGTAWAGTSARVPPASAARGEAGGTTWWQSRPEPVEVTPQDQFFGHAAAQPDGPLSNSTRYLCAAAYLNPDYANSVISELVASHRAVAPSLGIDLIPIIRHCLNARKAQLLRDVLLTVLLIAGLFLATAPIIAILVISFCLSFLPGVQWERRSLGIKVLVGLGAAVILAAIAVFYLVGSYVNAANGGAAPSFGPLATGFPALMVVLAWPGTRTRCTGPSVTSSGRARCPAGSTAPRRRSRRGSPG